MMNDPNERHDPKCEGEVELDTVQDESGNPWPIVVGEHCDDCGYEVVLENEDYAY